MKNGWAMCPRCGRKPILRILPETRGRGIVCFCRLCRTETILNIDDEPAP